MRLLDHDEPIDPEIAAPLDAIDAMLAGEPVDARYADLAEIALLLSAERPARRAGVRRARWTRGWRGGSPGRRRRRRRSAGAGARPGGSGRQAARWPRGGDDRGDRGPRRSGHGEFVGHRRRPRSFRRPVASSTSASEGAGQDRRDLGRRRVERLARRPGERVAPAAVRQARPSAARHAPTADTGRKVVQSAQLNLTAPPNRIDDVAQQVYNVSASERNRQELDRDPGRTGRLRGVPAQHPDAALGTDHEPPVVTNYAQVSSRTDSSQDITDQYGRARRALADARALRTSLLKQLAERDDDRAGRQPEGSDPRRRGVDLERPGHAQPPQPAGRVQPAHAPDQRPDRADARLARQWRVRHRQGRARRRPRADRGGRRRADHARRAARRSRCSPPCSGGSARALRRRRREQALDAA